MTTYSDHKIWQDVYRPKTIFGDLYLKFSVIDDVVVIDVTRGTSNSKFHLNSTDFIGGTIVQHVGSQSLMQRNHKEQWK